MDHSGVLVDLDDVGQVGCITAGEDIHLQAPLPEPPRQLGDIDVQTAGVSTPGVASGDVCMLIIATRCGYSTLARTFTSAERLQVRRRTSAKKGDLVSR